MPESTSLLSTRDALRPDYQRIACELRRQIGEGTLPPGSRLPSTEQLAKKWRSSVFTVHTALSSLVKEGWIDRIRGAGTFVSEVKQRFACAGIYHEADIGSSRRSDFVRNLSDCLLKRLHALKKETRIFTDSRPMNQRDTLLPALAEAMRNREIQCVIAPTATFGESPALAKIALPTAFAGNPGSPNRVDFDKDEFLRDGVRSLAAQGCGSLGLIYPEMDESIYDFQGKFLGIIRDEGLATRKSWISIRKSPEPDESFSYRAFQRLWKGTAKPDGLLVFPDVYVRGIITAVLQIGEKEVTPRMKFLFHRNAHIDVLCPFPVTWGISDEDLLAKSLIGIIEKQFRGETVAPTLLPYEMKFDDATRWR